MSFEDFFRKKKIDLEALGKAEPALLSEFKIHFEQMGEKSFDHTKKYWFNKLRLIYHLAPEVKEEKVVIENPLAEQTIADTLSETAAPPATVGFKPRFKAGMTKSTEPPGAEPEKPTEKIETPDPPAPTVGFKPRFKAGVTKPANTEQKEEPQAESPAEEKPIENTEAKPAIGFKPRFNMKNIKPKGDE
ncbi:MAG: hypothetical protein ACXVIY_10285 [Mucilaginibacter sp.]